MERYIENPVVDTTKTVPYFEPVILTDISTEDIPFYYISQEGDRLDSISTMFYKTADNWWVIAKANNLANGSIAIPAGTRLFIPNI
jgi:hypothetical protein